MTLPNLVLLPGMDGTGEMFAPFVSALGSECKALCVRYPGDAALGYAQLEALVRAWLPQGASYVVLGESFSGPIAAALSASPPPGMVGVVLCCTFVRNPRPQLAVFRGLLGKLPVKGVPVAAMVPALLGKHATSAMVRALAGALQQATPDTIRARLRSVLQVDARASLAAARVPVLYLQANQDRLVPESAAAEIASCLPSTTFVSLEGPHLLLQACPEAAAQAVIRFMRGFSSSAALDHHV
jgi:pimeloyl-ACP methyl ester carboxylesterase